LAQTIGATPVFKRTNTKLLKQVLTQGELVSLKEGEFLIRQGEDADYRVYLHVEGDFQVLADGRFILRIDQPGTTIGEMAVLQPDVPRSADVQAMSPSKVICVQAHFLKNSDPESLQLANSFFQLTSGILTEKLALTTKRAKLYEDAVLERQETERYAQEVTNFSEDLKRELQEKLAEIKLYSEVVETNRDAIVVSDAHGQILNCNQAFREIFGFSKQEALKMTLADLFNDFSENQEYFLHQVKSGWSGDKHAKPKVGPIYPAQITISPLKAQEDKTKMLYSSVIRDMTLEKEHESNLIKTNNELQQTYTELERTLKALEQSNSAKDQFFSSISGQIKTPLVSLVNTCEMMLGDPHRYQVSTDVAEMTSQIHGDAKKMERMVGNLVSLAEMNPELSQQNFIPISLERFLGRVRTQLDDNPRFMWEVGDHIKELVVDPEKFFTAFIEILEYALNVGDRKGSIYIQFTYSNGRKEINISISVGEVACHLPSMKEASPLADGIQLSFQDADLHLPLAKRIIELHKGEMMIHSSSRSSKIQVRISSNPTSDFELRLKIVIVDEQSWDRKLLKGIIERIFPSCEVFEFKNQLECLNALNAIGPDLVVIDPFFNKGNWSYDAFLQKVKSSGEEETSTLVISELLNDIELRQKVIGLGVTDFIFKPYTIQDASFKIRSIIETKQRFRKLSSNVQEAEKSAFTDGLTGLYNRRYYDHFIKEEMMKAQLNEGQMVVIMGDVDNFKHYNDTNGHQMGDLVLTKVAKVLQESVRKNDLVARYGGEEFVMVLPGASLLVGSKIAELMRQKLEETPFPKEASQPLGKVTASFGVSFYPEHGSTGEELLKKADQCLYVAKERGRNQVVLTQGQ